MSLRLEMLQVARLAPKVLGDSADLVRRFLQSQQNPDGGFKDRGGGSDLYYTVFGLESLLALRTDFNLGKVAGYLRGFETGQGLDFIHLACLARCWATIASSALEDPPALGAPDREAIGSRIEQFRAADGGYHPSGSRSHGSVYGCFLALGAYQDLGVEAPDPLRLAQCLKWMETPDGAWANEPGMTLGSTNATAAAATLLRNLQLPVHDQVAEWLLARFHPQGGFVAAPNAPMPDLLSTATTLHALSGLQIALDHCKEPCLDYIDTLWTNEGSFYGHWAEDRLDCEYTYYGLLALGHLSV